MGISLKEDGVNLFVASSVGKVKFEKITLVAVPFITVMIICVLLIAFIPALSLWLPGLTK